MTENKPRRLSATARCPCNSGKKYGTCCYSKGFEWMRDERGKIVRVVPVHPMLKEVLSKIQQDFIKQFGRKPTPRDPVLFQKYSAKWVKDKLAEVMFEAGIDPAYIYAYQKTGLLVCEENLNLIPVKDLLEWKAAIREFKRKQLKPLTPERRAIRKFLNQMSLVAEICDRAIIFLRSIVRDHGVARNITAKKKVHHFNDYMFFCATKALKSLGAIQLLVPEGFGEDALTLVRGVYESYLNMAFLLANPGKVNDLVVAKVRLSAGLCEIVKTATGKKVIQEKKGSQQFERLGPIHLARGSAYREDIRIHNVFYDFLCEHAHPNIMSMEAFLNKDKFEEANAQMVNQATIYSALYALLILDILLRFKFLDNQFRDDLARFLQESRPRMIKMFGLVKVSGKWIDTVQHIISRLNHLGLVNKS